MVFYDNAQNIYRRATPNWKALGLDMRGRSDVMRESFRTTRPILELALNLCDRLRPLERDPDIREQLRLGLLDKRVRELHHKLVLSQNILQEERDLVKYLREKIQDYENRDIAHPLVSDDEFQDCE